MTIAVFLQARMSSSRLPGKVLMPLAGKPMLLQQIERIKQARSVDELVVCTSVESSDDGIAKLCRDHQITCFRGSLNDVLDRFYQANQQIKAQHIIRLTGDCPLIDPSVIDAIVTQHLAEQNDYTSNCHPYTLPDGLDVEIFTEKSLNTLWQTAQANEYREHVTLYINQHPQHFKRGNYRYSKDYSSERWTVDHLEDFEMVSQVFNTLYPDNPNFTLEDVVTFLHAHPEIKQLNRHHIST